MTHYADIHHSIGYDQPTLLIASESVTDDVMLGLACNPILGLLLVAHTGGDWHDIDSLAVDLLGEVPQINQSFAEAERLLSLLASLAQDPATAETIRRFISDHSC